MEELEEFDVGERRVSKRIRFAQAVEYHFPDPNHYGGSLSADLSETGVRININEFIPLHTELSLKIKLETASIVETLGRVVWINKLPYSDRYQAGIKFSESENYEQSRQEIKDFVVSS